MRWAQKTVAATIRNAAEPHFCNCALFMDLNLLSELSFLDFRA